MAIAADAERTTARAKLRNLREAPYWTLVLPMAAVVALVAYFGARNTNFVTTTNAVNIGRQASVLLLLALAGTVIILIGSIDLSVGANATLSGIVVATYVDSAGSAGAVLIGIAVGAMVGVVNGLLYTQLRIPSFLVTLGMLSILTGVTGKVSNGEPVLFSSQSLSRATNGSAVGDVPNIILIALGTAILLIAVGARTKFGRYLYAIGGGEPVAALSGVRLKTYKTLAFVLAGALCGLAGAMLTAQIQAGTPLAADPLLLDSIAAVVIGGTALSGGVGGFHRTILGVLVISVLSNGMDVTGVHPYTQAIVKGTVVIAAVGLTIDRKKYLFMK